MHWEIRLNWKFVYSQRIVLFKRYSRVVRPKCVIQIGAEVGCPGEVHVTHLLAHLPPTFARFLAKHDYVTFG